MPENMYEPNVKQLISTRKLSIACTFPWYGNLSKSVMRDKLRRFQSTRNYLSNLLSLLHYLFSDDKLTYFTLV